MPWRAEEAPDPRLLVLNEALAAELGLDAGCAAQRGRRPAAGRQRRCPDGADAGRAGLRRAPVRRLLAAARRRPRAAARRADRRRRPPPRPAPQGLGPHAVRPRRRRQGGRRADAARVRHQRGDARARHPDDPRARRRRDRRRGRSARRCCPARCSPASPASHLRVGTLPVRRGAPATSTLLRRLADYAIARHHPRRGARPSNPYLALFERVVDAQASLVARWMLVGFIHGVMNTDNMTISGETIDYGPCAFMDAYDPATVFSSIDHGGRYAYGNQPQIAQWNLARLAETLLPLIDDDQDAAVALAVEALGGVPRPLQRGVDRGHARQARPARRARRRGRRAADRRPARAAAGQTTSTTPSFFRALSASRPAATPSPRARLVLRPRGVRRAGSERWRGARARIADAMDRVNPVYIPRNHLVEEALAAATGRRPRAVRATARRGHPPVRRAARPRALRRARRPRDFGGPTGRSAAPDRPGELSGGAGRAPGSCGCPRSSARTRRSRGSGVPARRRCGPARRPRALRRSPRTFPCRPRPRRRPRR